MEEGQHDARHNGSGGALLSTRLRLPTYFTPKHHIKENWIDRELWCTSCHLYLFLRTTGRALCFWINCMEFAVLSVHTSALRRNSGPAAASAKKRRVPWAIKNISEDNTTDHLDHNTREQNKLGKGFPVKILFFLIGDTLGFSFYSKRWCIKVTVFTN